MLRIAWRSALRQKQFSILNILGLSIGITTCLLIGLYVKYELNYDSFHTHQDRVYRINQSFIWGDWDEQQSTTGPNVAIALSNDIPEFEEVTRVLAPSPFVVKHTSKSNEVTSLLQKEHLVADHNFFEIFTFKTLQGNLSEALTGPNKVVLTSETAHKYFGDDNPIGKTLEMRGVILEGNQDLQPAWESFEVTAVIQNLPQNSHISFDMVSSMSSYPEIKSMESTWSWTAFVNYGLVREGTDITSLEAKIQEVPKKHAVTTLQRLFNQNFDELEASGKSWNLYLQPLKDVYLDTQKVNIVGATGSQNHLNIFALVGTIILLLSCINFMNLSTARATKRSREIGIRKVLGSRRTSLIKQFVFESLLYTLVSMFIALIASELLITPFNSISGKELNLNQELSNPAFLLTLLISVIALGLVSGLYPAFYISSFKSSDILKGKPGQTQRGKGLRNALVVFQFVASIVLIISTFFVHKQLVYSTNLDMGYDQDHVLQLHNIEQLDHPVKFLKGKLASNSAISSIGQSHEVPPNILRGDILITDGPERKELQVKRMKLDVDYLNLLEPEFLVGRNFNPANTTDKHYGVILNTTAVKALGWGLPENYADDSPIGKQFISARNQKFKVIGVVKDFHMNNARHELMPLVIYHIDNPFLPDSGTSPSYLSLRLNKASVSSSQELSKIISDIQSELALLDPTYPFEYSFMDQVFEQSFKNERRLGQILNIFTTMAIIIACLGLFGLAAFSAETRIKELGIRKVLGAETFKLMVTFSSEFTRLVFIALLISMPLAYYVVQYWLTDFAYKTPIVPGVFVLAGVAAMLIAWSTISFQSYRVASENPVKALRNE